MTTSHDKNGNANPNYPKELQPRNRGRDTSQAQIARIAKNLDPDMLGRTRNASNGAPIVGSDGIVESGIRTAYTFEDLIYEPRNPRADVSCAGYGLPETELLIRLVTGFLNAMSLNNNVFDKNSIPKGVLHLFGNYSAEDLAAFRRYWQNMGKGVNNAFAMPILASKDQASAIKFEKFGVDFSEMMFAKWMTFLTSLICAIYGMSPSEINFDSFTGGTTSALGGNDTAEKLAASKDSGLRPLLSYFENLLTDYVVSELDNDFCFRWTGLDVEDQDKKYELRKTLLTLNELRAEEGYEKIDGALGDAPVEASLLNAWMQLQAAQQPEQGEEAQDSKDEDKEPLQKANSHHDDHGRFAASDSGSEIVNGIDTLQAAEHYYQDHIAGVWRLTIQRKAGNFDVNVNFNENQDHAYTKNNKETGLREFDAVRAKFMPQILGTITSPDVILQNGNRDLFIEKQLDNVHYAVVLEWKDLANEYRFRSAHCWDKAEYDKNKKNYSKPSVRGKKVGQKKAPERLIKSSGAYSTFTHLRDTFEELQTPPTCQSALVQLNELGGELVETSSCYPTVSIDGLPEFVKSIDWHSVSLDLLHKAHSHDTPHDIFKPHENDRSTVIRTKS